MKYKKSIIISVVVIIVFSLIIGAIYFDTHYAVIGKKIYKNNTKSLSTFAFTVTPKELSKCTNLEELKLTGATENYISKLTDFNNLRQLMLIYSDVSDMDCKKISMFNNLGCLQFLESNVTLQEFNNISTLRLFFSDVKNLELLSECESLKYLSIESSRIANDCIIETNGKYILIDSSIFELFNNLISLSIVIDEIQDISGILEMDSLETFWVNRDSISEEDVKSLEKKGITVTYCD